MSLIELLFALLIMSIAGLGLTHIAAETLRNAGQMEHHALASMVADNGLAEALLFPVAPGRDSGTERLGGLDWPWTRIVAINAGSGLVQIELVVTGPGEEDLVLVRRTGWQRSSR